MDDHSIGTELAAGSLGGCAGIVVGQPMDRLKVIMQSRAVSTQAGASAWRLGQHILRTEGPLAMFRGLLTPLLAAAPQNALLFSTYTSVLQGMDALGLPAPAPPPALSSPLPEIHAQPYTISSWGVGRHLTAGAISGIFASFILTPAELAKCVMQVDMGRQASHPSSLACIRHRIQTMGLAQGAFQGLNATLVREIMGFALYFGVYQYSRAYLVRAWEPDPGRARRMTYTAVISGDPSWVLLLSGGLAGLLSWAAIFPIDVIKTRIQTAPQTMSMLQAWRGALQDSGSLRGLYKGLGVTMARGFLVNAVTFYVYEKSVQALLGVTD